MGNEKVFKAKRKSFSTAKFGNGKNFHMERKKEISERKRIEKAKMLRDYARLCKREGIESDRVHIGPKVECREPDGQETTEEVIPRKGKQKQPKVNPFSQEQKKAELEKAQIDLANRASKDNQKVMEQKRAQRNAERKKHLVRTKRGQPIMANQIQSLLGKLKSEAGNR